MAYCTKCGKKLDDGMLVCTSCKEKAATKKSNVSDHTVKLSEMNVMYYEKYKTMKMNPIKYFWYGVSGGTNSIPTALGTCICILVAYVVIVSMVFSSCLELALCWPVFVFVVGYFKGKIKHKRKYPENYKK